MMASVEETTYNLAKNPLAFMKNTVRWYFERYMSDVTKADIKRVSPIVHAASIVNEISALAS